MTDKELIRSVHSGNKEAFTMIAEKYYDDIYRFCLYYTGNKEDSYDIVQDVFLRFIHYVDSYTHKNLKGYLLIIARNLCRDYFSNRKDMVCLEEAELVTQAGASEERVENKIILWQAFQKIPTEQREVIILRIYEEFKFHEIAKMLGCNVSTAKSRFRLGLANMKKVMRMEEKDAG